MSARLRIGFVIGALLAAGPASAQNDPPDYDFDWVTIGNPGNRDTIPDEVPKNTDLAIGGVNYKYRIARTEVTVKQHFEFVQAYWPYWDGSYDDSSLVGYWIRNVGPKDKPQFKIIDGAENRPTEMSWRMAARFVNWLHNGKGTGPEAFADGVYDTSTFGAQDNGDWENDQEVHSPDARFWIPTLDEWTKAMHYDPNRYGPGHEGYWLRPDSGNEDLISDWPWNGGETGAGMEFDPVEDPWLDVGAYPWTQSPWGLLDGSGGVTEWMEDFSKTKSSRLAKGTSQEKFDPLVWDRVDRITGSPPTFAWGLRIASAIPSPFTSISLALGAICLERRRR